MLGIGALGQRLIAGHGARAAAPAMHVSGEFAAKPRAWALEGIAPDAGYLLYRAGLEPGPDTDRWTGVLASRRLDGDATAVIAGTEGVHRGAISPDGKWLAFLTAHGSDEAHEDLKKVPLANGEAAGPPIVVCANVARMSGVCWASDGEVVMTSGRPDAAVWVVEAGGGAPRAVARDEKAEGAWSAPAALPGGRVVLVDWAEAPKGGGAWIEAVDLTTGARKKVLDGATGAEYLPTGHLLARRGTTLVGAAFDPAALEVRGEPVAVRSGVTDAPGVAAFDVSRTGVLAVEPAPPPPPRRLAWVDDKGVATPIAGLPAREYYRPALAPDGTAVVCPDVDSTAGGSVKEFLLYDLAHAGVRRFVVHGQGLLGAVWNPDGKRIAYGVTSAGGPAAVWEQRVDQAAAPEQVYAPQGGAERALPVAWSPDGSLMLVMVADSINDTIVWVVDRRGSLRPRRYFGRIVASHIAFARDGKAVAFVTEVQGRWEVHLQPFTGVMNIDLGDRVRVSTGGVMSSAGLWWSPDGKEIRYVDPERRVMSAGVRLGAKVTTETPRALYTIRDTGAKDPMFAADGRVLVVLQEEAQEPRESRADLVLNFLDEVSARVGAGKK
jgi:Tol biopolymer transport system component